MAAVAVVVGGAGVAAGPAYADTVPGDWQPEAEYVVEASYGTTTENFRINPTYHNVIHHYEVQVGGERQYTTESMEGSAKGSPEIAWNVWRELHVFVRGSNDQMFVRWQWEAGQPYRYSDDWYAMRTLNVRASSNPTAILNENGKMELFVRGADQSVWTIWQTQAGGGWSNWASLGGTCISSPRATFEGTTVKVFCYGSDSKRWFKYRPRDLVGWSAWQGG